MAKLQIFRPGRHTAMSGASLAFSETDLAATAKAYDPAVHEAPLVVGHPEHNAPAYGWVKGLAFADGGLEAEPDQVEPQFAELVKAGRFKKISASFYTPDSPSNPVPGVYYLRHVGFLGAQPPAVKGLREPGFADGETGVVEFGDWEDQVEAGLWRRLREWLIGRFGIDEADKAVPGYDVNALQTAANTPETTPEGSAPGFSEEDVMSQELAAREAALKVQAEALAAKELAFAEMEKKVQAREAQLVREGHVAFTEDLVKEGKLLAAHKDGAVNLLCSLSGDATASFGESNALDWFKGFLAAQAPKVHFGEVAPAGVNPPTVNFAAPQGYSVDPDALALHVQAVAYQRANPSVTYEAAIAAVQTA